MARKCDGKWSSLCLMPKCLQLVYNIDLIIIGGIVFCSIFAISTESEYGTAEYI